MKFSYIISVMIFIICGELNAQHRIAPDEPTPGGFFDTLFDRFGKKYAIKNLEVNFNAQQTASLTGKPISGGGASVFFSIPTASCQAGYFRLYFAGGLGLNTPLANDVRAVYCQLFNDLSCFIASPLSSACNTTTNNTTFVNIYIDDSATGVVLGSFTPLFSFPLNPATPYPGITENLIHKTIVSGVDAYLNTISPVVGGFPGGFYHGIIAVNPTANWNFNTSIPIGSIPPGLLDFYTVCLHEAFHGLGFASLISPLGSSLYGPSNNYYSLFDTHIVDYLGTNLITNGSSSCTAFGYSINPSAILSSLTGSYCSPPTDLTNNCATAPRYVSSIDMKLYNPNCFELGSSLSHFEDMCSPTVNAANNNLLYVMSNAYGGVKRFPKEEERQVLCDLGYSVSTIYNSPVVGGVNTYTSGACQGLNIWGVNDGITNSGYSFIPNYNFLTAINIPISTIIANDAPSTTTVSCVSFVYPMPGLNLSVVSGSIILQLASGPLQSCGPILLQYLPVNNLGQTGNPTYIYAYLPCGAGGFCNPPNLCDLVQNGGFESTSSSFGNGCGIIPVNAINCWEVFGGTIDFVTRNCTGVNAGTSVQLPPLGTSLVNNTWNGTPNDKIIGIYGQSGTTVNSNLSLGESMKSYLGMPLIPTNTYVVSFWVYKQTTNYSSSDFVFTLVSSPNVAASALYPGPSFPQAGFTPLASFTVGAAANNKWKYYTTTVVFNGSVNHSVMMLGMNELATTAINTAATDAHYFWIDDVSIIPISASATFTPPTNICSGNSITNLGQYASINGTFTGVGVSNNGSTYDFNANANSPLPAGVYPVVFTYTTNPNCTKTIVAQITVSSSFNLVINAPSSTFCSNITSTMALVASNSFSTPTSYTWQPGGILGQTIIVTPTASIVYTLSSIYQPVGCLITTTLAVTVSSNCCSQTTLVSSSSGLIPSLITTGTTLTGLNVINQNTTFGSGAGAVTLQNAEFLIAPNVQITIPTNVILELRGVHLYACSTDMWQGMNVIDGGHVLAYATPKNSLIEDAIVAINMDNITVSHATPIIEVTGVVFNKNYIGIKFSNSAPAVDFLPTLIKSCVFTSRTLTFTSVAWPNSTTTSGNLRFAAASATNGLAPPYTLQNFPFTNLKGPYTNQPSHIGIQIDNVGNVAGLPTTTTGVDIGITYIGGTPGFNLFDGIGIGIDVKDASLSTMNNVFQNMKYYLTSSGMFGGKGINHIITSLMNARLDLSPVGSAYQSTSFGNRFWNCYDAITTRNVFEFTAKYNIFRSTQTTAGLGAYGVGANGIILESNRFKYNVSFSEFNNLHKGIFINTYPALYDIGGGALTGVYASSIDIKQNYFGARVTSTTAIGNSYLGDAVTLNGTGITGLQFVAGGAIQSNKINRVYRGVSINTMNSYPVKVEGNLISLVNDNIFSVPRQYGVQGRLSQGGGLSIRTNTISGSGITNQRMTLIYCYNNVRPIVVCNHLSASFNAFEFELPNVNTAWRGNIMNNHARGLVLSNNGVISQQGATGMPSGNQWAGTWPGTSFKTFVIGPGNANSSPLFVSSAALFYPNTNGSSLGGVPYNTVNVITTSGTYTCPSVILPAPPSQKMEGDVELALGESLLKDSKWHINIFPNPTDGYLSVLSSVDNEVLNIKILDVSGKVVYTVDLQSKLNNLYVGSLENGVYLAEIQNSTNKIYKKLVICK